MTKIPEKDSGEARMTVGVGRWENPFKREVMITHFLIFFKKEFKYLRKF